MHKTPSSADNGPPEESDPTLSPKASVMDQAPSSHLDHGEPSVTTENTTGTHPWMMLQNLNGSVKYFISVLITLLMNIQLF